MKSTRCPQKAMADIYGQPLIVRLLERLENTFPIFICTSQNPADDVLSRLSPKVGVVRGSEKDVSERFITAAELTCSENIIRVTGDNPLTDPDLLVRLANEHVRNKSDYTWCDDYPKGTKSEVIRVSALKEIYKTHNPENSEFMTYDLMDLTNQHVVTTGLNRSKVRLTVDYPEDLARIRRLYEDFKGKIPPIAEVIAWYDREGA